MTHPLTHLGDRIQGLTYGEMMEFAGEVRGYLLASELIDGDFVSTADIAAALDSAGKFIYATERNQSAVSQNQSLKMSKSDPYD